MCNFIGLRRRSWSQPGSSRRHHCKHLAHMIAFRMSWKLRHAMRHASAARNARMPQRSHACLRKLREHSQAHVQMLSWRLHCDCFGHRLNKQWFQHANACECRVACCCGASYMRVLLVLRLQLTSCCTFRLLRLVCVFRNKFSVQWLNFRGARVSMWAR